ncbi:MAG TPA: DUF4157 domain-containing protein [Fibrobacteria bacterium]|nr:DUF4157 domain-containing protein [Fibrobacteria bacterium]
MGIPIRVPGALAEHPVRIPAETGLPPLLQRKLSIGAANDPLEVEADRAAERAVAGESVSGLDTGTPKLHRRPVGTPAPSEAPGVVEDVLRSPGSPLEPASRAAMESSFGQDFGHVQVHAGSKAAESARAVNARAYTVGRDIVFGAGEYDTRSRIGRGLLAHELAHVVQQGGGSGSAGTTLRRNPVPDPLEDVPPEEKYVSHPLDQKKPDAPPPDPGASREERRIAAFDTTPGGKRPWNLNQLTKDIVTALQADPRAYVRIFGAFPTAEGDDDPKQNAWERANLVRKALIQWIGPHRFAEDRFDVAFASGKIGDPQIQVDIAYKSQILSNPTTPIPAPHGSPTKLDPDAPAPTTQEGDDLQSALAGNWTWHLNRPGKAERSVVVQLTQGSGTVQRVYQFQVDVDTGDVQALVGVQLQKESKTISVLKDAMKVKASVFLDLLGGITTARGEASGSITFQVQAGAQVTATFGPVTVAFQAAPSVTFQANQPLSLDFNASPQIGQDSLPNRTLPPFLGIPLIVGTF